jgi:hypothetical protein
MLTAEQVNEIVNYTAEDLTRLIQERYTTDVFLDAEFLGLSNGGEFVFRATWYNEEEDSEDTTKVFVRRTDSILTADY